MKSKYYRIARLFPALLTLLPLMTLTVFVKAPDIEFIQANLLEIKLIGNLTFGVILLYLLTQINRFISKYLFEAIYFKNELEFPTTNLIITDNQDLSSNFRYKIYSKVQKDFGIVLSDKFISDKPNNEERRIFADAIGLIRSKVGDGKLILQHNIEYGFCRNLVGGTIVSIPFSIIDIYYFNWVHNSSTLLIISSIYAVFFISILIISKYLLTRLGKQYAKQLFNEYLVL